MSTRSPIQVPEELKSKVDTLKDQFNTKTHYEVIEKLIESYHAFNRYKEDQRIKVEEEKERQRRDMIDIGPEAKAKFNELKIEMKLSKDSSLLELLLHHYGCSPSIDKSTFALYQSMK